MREATYVYSKQGEQLSFENLVVYQKALSFVNTIYLITDGFPKIERFVLVDQFRRAALSICLNIAEGYGGSSPEFKRYLNIAKGSVREYVALTTLCVMRKYIDREEIELRHACAELSKMLSGLIRSLRCPTHNS